MYNRKQFKLLARSLAVARDHRPEMRRYLHLRHRERVLRRAMRDAMADARGQNVLSTIGFKAPLSVYGEDPRVVVGARGLASRKIPVAFELDDKGEHRGTAMETVRTRLREAETPLADDEILARYEEYVLGWPLRPKHARVPEFMMRIAREQETLEALIVKLLDNPKYNTRRFMVIVDRDELHRVVGEIEPTPDKVVIVSYFGEGNPFLVDKRAVPVLSGSQSGAQTMWYADLCGLLEMGGQSVCIDCHALHWVGWISSKDDEGKPIRIGPIRRGYPGLKQEQEADDGGDEEPA